MGEARAKKLAGASPPFQEDKVTRLAVIIDWPYKLIPAEYMETLWASDVRLEPDVFLVRAGGPDISVCQNAMIKFALDQGADEILSVSVDQTVPKDILKRFRTHNKDLVAALTATRQPGHAWLTYEFNRDEGFVQKDPTKPLEKFDGVPSGCFLAKRSVFERVPAPWFFTTTDVTGTQLVVTSDFNFFANCRKHGVELWVDSDVISGHQYEVMLDAASLGRTFPWLHVVR